MRVVRIFYKAKPKKAAMFFFRSQVAFFLSEVLVSLPETKQPWARAAENWCVGDDPFLLGQVRPISRVELRYPKDDGSMNPGIFSLRI